MGGGQDHPSGLRGGTAMGTIRNQLVWGAALLLLVAARGPAAADEGLREKARKLNDITGQDAIKGTILDLVKDKPGVKKLLAEAAKMAKAKQPPFNCSGAHLLRK